MMMDTRAILEQDYLFDRTKLYIHIYIYMHEDFQGFWQSKTTNNCQLSLSLFAPLWLELVVIERRRLILTPLRTLRSVNLKINASLPLYFVVHSVVYELGLTIVSLKAATGKVYNLEAFLIKRVF